MTDTHNNVTPDGEFRPGMLVIVQRPKTDGTTARRPVLLLTEGRGHFTAAKIIGKDHLPPQAQARFMIEIDGCGLRRPSLIIPSWYFHVAPDAGWRTIGVCPTPIFNQVIDEYREVASRNRFIAMGRQAYRRS